MSNCSVFAAARDDGGGRGNCKMCKLRWYHYHYYTNPQFLACPSCLPIKVLKHTFIRQTNVRSHTKASLNATAYRGGGIISQRHILYKTFRYLKWSPLVELTQVRHKLCLILDDLLMRCAAWIILAFLTDRKTNVQDRRRAGSLNFRICADTDTTVYISGVFRISQGGLQPTPHSLPLLPLHPCPPSLPSLAPTHLPGLPSLPSPPLRRKPP